MGFNYGLEKRKFDREWDKLREEYRAAGMDEEAIAAMYAYDYDVFKGERTYQNHTQAMPDAAFDNGDEDAYSPLLKKFFDSLAVAPQTYGAESPADLVDAVESEALSQALAQLSEQGLELLWLNVFAGYSVTEIAETKKVSRPTISKKLKRIRAFLAAAVKNRHI